MIEILDMEQGTPEWRGARLGIVTASKFATVMAQGRGGGDSKTRREYMLKLMGERLTGEPMHNYQNDHMERGKEMEAEARDMYVFLSELEPKQVGFIRNGKVGCSPDSLIGNDGMLEIKTKLAHLQLDVLLGDALPSEHVAQVQGQLWVAEREWCDFVSYWPRLKPFMKRVYRDETTIAKIAAAVSVFENEMVGLLAQIQPKKAQAA